jgi:hypothetical protein
MASPNNKKQIMDVSKPGKTTPDATARPLIVGHSGMLKDPMMSPGSVPATTDAPASKDTATPIVKTRAGKVLQPISLTAADVEGGKDTDEGTPQPKTEVAAPEEPTTTNASEGSTAASTSGKGFTIIDNTSANAEPKKSVEPTPPTTTSDEPKENVAKDDEAAKAPAQSDDTKSAEEASSEKPEDAAVIDAVVDQAAANKAQKQEDKDLIARQEKIAKLIEDKTYFAPVKQAAARRKGKALVLVLILLLLLSAGAYAAVDMGIVKPGFDVPVHFLKKDAVTATTTAPVVTTPTPQPTASPTPTPASSGLSTYTSKDYGVAFSYPSAWGDVTAKKTSGTISGNSVRFSFSKQTMIQAGMLSKDYKENGRDSTCALLLGIMPGTTLASMKSAYADGDSTYNTATYKATTKFLKSTTDTLVYERFEAGQPDGMGGCSGVSVTGYKTFATGNYTGIEFLWANPDTSKTVAVTEFDKYKATPNNYLSEKDRSDVLATIDSAKTQ